MPSAYLEAWRFFLVRSQRRSAVNLVGASGRRHRAPPCLQDRGLASAPSLELQLPYPRPRRQNRKRRRLALEPRPKERNVRGQSRLGDNLLASSIRRSSNSWPALALLSVELSKLPARMESRTMFHSRSTAVAFAVAATVSCAQPVLSQTRSQPGGAERAGECREPGGCPGSALPGGVERAPAAPSPPVGIVPRGVRPSTAPPPAIDAVPGGARGSTPGEGGAAKKPEAK